MLIDKIEYDDPNNKTIFGIIIRHEIKGPHQPTNIINKLIVNFY